MKKTAIALLASFLLGLGIGCMPYLLDAKDVLQEGAWTAAEETAPIVARAAIQQARGEDVDWQEIGTGALAALLAGILGAIGGKIHERKAQANGATTTTRRR